MNTSVRVSDLQRWQGCVGMCIICGQPLGLSDVLKKGGSEAVDEAGEDEGVSQLEKLSLSEECPYRLCMMRFRLLGRREECHIVDAYTHLEKGSADERFERVFDRKKAVIEGLGDAYERFARDVFKTGEYEFAIAACRRVAKPLTFSGCRACNRAMDRSSAHANTIYRCFALTRGLNIAVLEENKQDAIKTKKLLEQIALYFAWDGGKWTAKNDDQLLLDTSLWRCIAHIYSWGRTASFRSRLVALFHAANYVYLKSTYRGLVSLEDWHIHIFQPFYMQHYAASSWFGLEQGEAGATFDLARKEGEHWVDYVQGKLEKIVLPAVETWAETEIAISNIQSFKDKISVKVGSEREMVEVAAQKRGVVKGLENLYMFYIFNIKDQAAYTEHFKRYMREMDKVYQTKKMTTATTDRRK